MLLQVWRLRQLEIKDAMASIVKPAEEMSKIAKLLSEVGTSEDVLSANMVELESYLEDVDNARDFHTIGGWTILIDALLSNRSDKVRSLAAWCVGTAVKNSYEYQLYTLETSEASDKSVLWRLSSMLEVDDEMSVRRALYALSSAARGNADVQAALQEKGQIHSRLDALLGRCYGESVEIERKIWSFISDMLDEISYIKTG